VTVTGEVAVVVTAGPDQTGDLAAVLAAIDAQEPAPAERVLIPFGRGVPDGVPASWTVLTGDWASRAEALDEGWSATTAPWVTFVGTAVPATFLSSTVDAVRTADADTAVLCPGREAGEWDYWALRTATRIGSAFTWRRAAAELAGWWPRRCDRSLDQALVLDLTAAGWKAVRYVAPSLPPAPEPAAEDGWNIRSLGIVSLHAGRESTFSKWADFLLTADLPVRTSLYAVDNGRRPEFTERLRAACVRIADARGFEHVDVAVDDRTYESVPDEWYLKRERNLHVARLYSSIMPRVSEDLVLTLEDDIDPPSDAVRRLVEEFARPAETPLAGISAAWDRVEGRYVCGGRADGGWGSPITWAELPREPLDVGCIGGACSVWSNAVVSRMPVLFDWDEQLGWDGLLCTQARRRGFTVRIHGGVRCVHHTWGVLRSTN
jgi:hypothetical protein